MRPADFDIHKLIDALNGTCSTIQEHLPDDMDELELTNEDHQTIDATIFCCNTCSWWCDIEEANESDDGDVCDDCLEETD